MNTSSRQAKGIGLIYISLACGVVLSLYGFNNTLWPEGISTHLSLILVIVLVILFCNKLLNQSPFLIGTFLTAIFAIISGTLWPLLTTLWFALAAAILGCWLLKQLKIEYTNWLTQFLVGSGVYGTVIGLLAHFPVNYPGVYGIMLSIPIIVGRRTIRQWFDKTSLLISFAQQYKAESYASKLLEIVIIAVALVHFVVAMMPEVGHDALAMHLFVPVHLLAKHQWGFDVTTYVWAVMPMLGDWLFSIGYMLAGETAARFINVGFIFALSWLVRDLVLWAGGTALGARWAVLIFLTTPLTFTESSSLFIESVWTTFVVAGVLAIVRALSSDNSKINHITIASILLGCALAAKAITLTILPVLLLFCILQYKLWLKYDLKRNLHIGICLFVTLGIIPYLTAWAFTGNPVFPFYNQIFQSSLYPIVNFKAPSEFGKGVAWNTLYDMTFHSGKYLEGKAGAAGFQWLLLFVPAVVVLFIGWQRRGIGLIFIATLFIIFTFQPMAYLRYVFPSFAITSSCIGIALSSSLLSESSLLRRCTYVIACLTIGLNLLFFNSGTYYGDVILKPLMSPIERDLYLQKRLPIRNAVVMVNCLNLDQTPVAVFSNPLAAGLIADGLYPNWYNHTFKSLVNVSTTETEFANLFLDKGVDYIILDTNWGNNEKRLAIENATDKLADFYSITVRTLKRKYRFQTELLKNPTISSTDSWITPNGALTLTTKGISVNVSSPAYQIVPITAGMRYLNTITAMCGSQPAQGRLQVNWMDFKSNFISTDIHVFDCSSLEVKHTMEITAPQNASFAAVYASGHTLVPLKVSEVSFRK